MFASPADVVDALKSEVPCHVLKPFEFASTLQNQLLLFLKPEVFVGTTHKQQAAIVDIVFSRMNEYGLAVCGCAVLTGDFLDGTGAMDRHYGFINRVSRFGARALTDDEVCTIRSVLAEPSSARILGGHEFLQMHPELTAGELNRLWATEASTKLKSGLYVRRATYGDEAIVWANAFHPAQLEHFTQCDRRIILLLLATNYPWKVLRQRFLGDTFPERAFHGSVRRVLLENGLDLGLGKVSISNNCVHLSAGPLEGLFEIENFLGSIPSLSYSRQLTCVAREAAAQGLSLDQIGVALTNPDVSLSGQAVPVFTATEDVDTVGAVALLASKKVEFNGA